MSRPANPRRPVPLKLKRILQTRRPPEVGVFYDALNHREKAFVAAFIRDPNQTRAVAAAIPGLKRTSATVEGHRLLRRANVVLAIAEARMNQVNAGTVSTSWVVERLIAVIERCMQERPVLDADGNPTGAFVFDSKGANAALNMLMKHTGGYLANNVQRKMSADEAEELLRQRLGSDIIERLRGGRRAPPLPAAREEGAGPAGANGVH